MSEWLSEIRWIGVNNAGMFVGLVLIMLGCFRRPMWFELFRLVFKALGDRFGHGIIWFHLDCGI